MNAGFPLQIRRGLWTGERSMRTFLLLHVYHLAVKVTVYSVFALLYPQTGKFPRRLPTQKLSPAATLRLRQTE